MIPRSEQYQDYIARLFPSELGGKVRVITFQVTDACNLRCTYCYQINKSTHRMSFDVAKRYIDMILSADENSNEYINPTNTSGIAVLARDVSGAKVHSIATHKSTLNTRMGKVCFIKIPPDSFLEQFTVP